MKQEKKLKNHIFQNGESLFSIFIAYVYIYTDIELLIATTKTY